MPLDILGTELRMKADMDNKFEKVEEIACSMRDIFERILEDSIGTLLTPRFVPGLTLRVDWTRITIRNAYFDPRALLVANTVEQQQAFEDFLAAHPERFTREAPAPGDPFSVGKIVFIDATQTNLSYFRSEAIDFSGDYRTAIGEDRKSVE